MSTQVNFEQLAKNLYDHASSPEDSLKFVNMYLLIPWALMILPRYGIFQKLVKLVPFIVTPLIALYGVQLYNFMQDPKNAGFTEEMFKGITAKYLAQSFGDSVGAVVAWFHMVVGDIVVGYWIYHESLRYKINYVIHVVLMVAALAFNPFGVLLYLLVRPIFGTRPIDTPVTNAAKLQQQKQPSTPTSAKKKRN